MMRIALLLIVFIAGCVNLEQKWTKADAAPKEFVVADAQCEAEGVARANAIATHIARFYYLGCMQAKGWTPPAAPKEEREEPKHESPKEEGAKH
jgi:hypothetical protein